MSGLYKKSSSKLKYMQLQGRTVHNLVEAQDAEGMVILTIPSEPAKIVHAIKRMKKVARSQLILRNAPAHYLNLAGRGAGPANNIHINLKLALNS